MKTTISIGDKVAWRGSWGRETQKEAVENAILKIKRYVDTPKKLSAFLREQEKKHDANKGIYAGNKKDIFTIDRFRLNGN